MLVVDRSMQINTSHAHLYRRTLLPTQEAISLLLTKDTNIFLAGVLDGIIKDDTTWLASLTSFKLTAGQQDDSWSLRSTYCDHETRAHVHGVPDSCN